MSYFELDGTKNAEQLHFESILIVLPLFIKWFETTHLPVWITIFVTISIFCFFKKNTAYDYIELYSLVVHFTFINTIGLRTLGTRLRLLTDNERRDGDKRLKKKKTITESVCLFGCVLLLVECMIICVSALPIRILCMLHFGSAYSLLFLCRRKSWRWLKYTYVVVWLSGLIPLNLPFGDKIASRRDARCTH